MEFISDLLESISPEVGSSWLRLMQRDRRGHSDGRGWFNSPAAMPDQ
ncbi:hypothetical protein RISK_000480 [Rhodopirellula islandica]|uniref:Uncharacterized protein n=1 Tax=Rhodopirellula islandica TaxID=595434 RepID=A0A0J1BLN7_RHOIS|nr:hypothetical protein RISK_000480 [Rhodopirellula islandica]